ncbi:MAG TPA: hypothetical protein VEU62_17265 [Bryobacterales bacterium]|nr:hypothetical protein [Bryobacterales bacterium]
MRRRTLHGARWRLLAGVLLTALLFSKSLDIITTIAGNGTLGYSGDGKLATQAQFTFLIGDPSTGLEDYVHPAFDAAGNLYIPDQGNDRIRMIAPNGIITTVAGSGQTGFNGDRGPATQASLHSPNATLVDAAGNLYFTDQDNHRVRKVDTSGNITTVAGDGDLYAEPGNGNGGPATSAGLNAPAGLALDAAGNLYICDTYNTEVRKVKPDGTIVPFAGSGQHSYGGDGGPAVYAAMDFPAGITADAAGNVYIADQHNDRIRKVDTNGIITTIAGNGEQGYCGDGGPAVKACLNYPSDIAFDAAGNMYIADEDNNVVRKVTPDGTITTVVGSSGQGYGGDGGPPLLAALNRPSGLAFDKQGNLIIVDQYNYRIRRVTFNAPVLAASPGSLAFAATAGGAAPAAQTFSVANSGGGTISYTITSDQPWLAATPGSGTVTASSPATITVTVNIASLAPGSYTGTLSVAASGVSRSPQTVAVTLTMQPMALPAPVFTSAGVKHAASFVLGPVAPGEIVSIFGSNLGPAAAVMAQLDPATGRLASTLGGLTVTFNGLPGALFFGGQNQINVEAPYELAGGAGGLPASVSIVVRYAGMSSAPVSVPMAAAAPGLFTVNAQGTGQAALLNQDSSPNSASNPAARGSVVQIFLTGQGATNPSAVTGQLPQPPFPAPALPVAVQIGGIFTRTTFVGLAPGLAGLLQVNAVVPDEASPAGNVPLQVTVGSALSQPGVTLAVK